MLNYATLIVFMFFFAAGSGYAKNYTIITRYDLSLISAEDRRKIAKKYLLAAGSFSLFFFLTAIFIIQEAGLGQRLIACILYLILIGYYFLFSGRRGGTLPEDRQRSHLKGKDSQPLLYLGGLLFIVLAAWTCFTRCR